MQAGEKQEEKQQDEEKKKLFVAIDGNRVPDGIGSSSDGGGGGGDDGGVSVTAEVLATGACSPSRRRASWPS